MHELFKPFLTVIEVVLFQNGLPASVEHLQHINSLPIPKLDANTRNPPMANHRAPPNAVLATVISQPNASISVAAVVQKDNLPTKPVIKPQSVTVSTPVSRDPTVSKDGLVNDLNFAFPANQHSNEQQRCRSADLKGEQCDNRTIDDRLCPSSILDLAVLSPGDNDSNTDTNSVHSMSKEPSVHSLDLRNTLANDTTFFVDSPVLQPKFPPANDVLYDKYAAIKEHVGATDQV